LRWLLLFFGIGSMLMGLEEISYGQHYLGLASPRWAVRHNKQHEINIHNLGDDSISRILRRIAELGLPVFGVALPLVLDRFPRTYRRGDWTYYLLPRNELFMVLALALLVRVNHDFDDKLFGALSDGLGEVQELFWALAGLFWIAIVAERLRSVLDRDRGRAPEKGV
jgi:hypothetical protein